MILQHKPNSGKLLIILDASAFSESSCILRTFYTTVLGLTGKVNNNDMEFGSAFHKFRAHFREFGQEGLPKALQLAREYFANTPMHVKHNKKYLTDKFLVKTCLGYADKYEKDNFKPVFDGGHCLLELKFAPPHLIYTDDRIELILAGTKDELGKFVNGVYSIADAKTSSVWDIKSYFDGYLLSPQLIFYRWILREYAREFPESILGKIDSEGCGVFIDGIFYGGADAEIKYERSSVWMFREETLDEFGILLNEKKNQLIKEVNHWLDTGTIPLRYGMLNGACGTKYGACKYFTVCSALDDTVREIIIENNFIKKQYNPLEFGQ